MLSQADSTLLHQFSQEAKRLSRWSFAEEGAADYRHPNPGFDRPGEVDPDPGAAGYCPAALNQIGTSPTGRNSNSDPAAGCNCRAGEAARHLPGLARANPAGSVLSLGPRKPRPAGRWVWSLYLPCS